MAVPDQLGTYSLRSAEAADASRVAALVDAAYRHYVQRIGMLPGPMTDDDAEVIHNAQVTVAEHHGAIVGIVVLAVTDEGFLVDNVAVHPSHRGTGLDGPCLSSRRPRRGAPGSTPSTSPPTSS